MGHTALSAWSTLIFQMGSGPSRHFCRGPYGKKKLERLRKRRARPTLNKAYDQHSMNVPFWGIQFWELRQRWYLWWNCARQGIGVEFTARKKTWKHERRRMWPTLTKVCKLVVDVQVFQIDQSGYLRWYRPRKLVATNRVTQTPNIVTWPLERLRKRRARPTLNKAYDQHSMNVPFWGIQVCQLRQRWYLWWNCARQGIAAEVTVRKKLENVC